MHDDYRAHPLILGCAYKAAQLVTGVVYCIAMQVQAFLPGDVPLLQALVIGISTDGVQ